MSNDLIILFRYGVFSLLLGLAFYFGIKGAGDIFNGIFYEEE